MEKAKSSWRNGIRAWGPVLVYMAAIFTLSSQPDLPAPFPFEGADKAAHAVIYLGLALLAYRAARKSPMGGRPSPYFQSFLVTSLYGVSDEYHQMFVSGRMPDKFDWLADVAGAVLALILIVVIKKVRNKEGRKIGEDQEREGSTRGMPGSG